MISREQVESLLKINGMSAAAPDEEIRSVLLSARYSQDEADTALMILREDMKTKQTQTDGLHKIFRSDEGLQPKEISKLLGIEVDASQFGAPEKKQVNYAVLQYVAVWFFSMTIAIGGVLGYMYFNQVGLFHSSAEEPLTTLPNSL